MTTRLEVRPVTTADGTGRVLLDVATRTVVLTPDEARALAQHLTAAADDVGDGTHPGGQAPEPPAWVGWAELDGTRYWLADTDEGVEWTTGPTHALRFYDQAVATWTMGQLWADRGAWGVEAVGES